MYVPAVQLMQAEAPVDAMYVPAGHNEQVVADADVAPVCPYLPVEQRLPEQVDEEVAAEYVPAAQSMQVDCPAFAYLPAVQLMQVAELVCPVAPEYLPAAQSMQVDCPVVSAYLPAVHLVQVKAAAAEYGPAPQSAQVEAAVAATAAENLPAAQL